MKRQALLALIAAILTLGPAIHSFAAFQAAELVYLPIAARTAGQNGSEWYTDLTITNVAEDAIDVCIFIAPSGGGSNSFWYDRQYALGGREDEGWATVVPELADIPPQGSVLLSDIIGEYFVPIVQPDAETPSLTAGLIIFGYAAGTVNSEDGPDYRNLVAQAKNYTKATVWVPPADEGGEFTEEETEYGHAVLGVPWYNTGDPAVIDEDRDLTFMVLGEGTENEDYRYNVGFMNCSDMQTTLQLLIEARGPDGELLENSTGGLAGNTITLAPLAQVHSVQIIKSLLGQGNNDQFTIWITVIDWTSTAEQPEDVKPGFTTYGTLVNSLSNDATWVNPSFGEPYPVECAWGRNDLEPTASSVSASSFSSDRGPLPLAIPKR